jgi:hypothetical protein
MPAEPRLSVDWHAPRSDPDVFPASGFDEEPLVGGEAISPGPVFRDDRSAPAVDKGKVRGPQRNPDPQPLRPRPGVRRDA